MTIIACGRASEEGREGGEKRGREGKEGGTTKHLELRFLLISCGEGEEERNMTG